MKTNREILEKEFEVLKQELTEKHISLGMQASGNWVESLEVVASDSSVTLLGNSYTEQLSNGREPGQMPPIQTIEQWILDKGIAPIESNITTSTLAFLIARKIAREGTRYFKEGGTDLVDSIITPQRIQLIIDQLSSFRINEFVSDVTGVLEELATAA